MDSGSVFPYLQQIQGIRNETHLSSTILSSHFLESLTSSSSYQVELNLFAACCVKPWFAACGKYFFALSKQVEDQCNPT